jgi:AcrR family transcriptional regulator
MTSLTEQKLLDAALKLFAENGYAGARTRFIAEEAGLSEMTLFRKFKTKENLFNAVLVQNQEKILNDFDSIFLNDDFENIRDFLESLINELVDVIENNYDYVNVFLNERCRITETIIEAFIKHLGEYIHKHSSNVKVDYQVLAFTFLAFTYFLIFDEYRGRQSLNREEAIERFIDHSVMILES